MGTKKATKAIINVRNTKESKERTAFDSEFFATSYTFNTADLWERGKFFLS